MCACGKHSEAVSSSPTQARCYEEENEFLESQILELEESGPSAGVSGSRGPVADRSLDAVVDRLRRERVRALPSLWGDVGTGCSVC